MFRSPNIAGDIFIDIYEPSGYHSNQYKLIQSNFKIVRKIIFKNSIRKIHFSHIICDLVQPGLIFRLIVFFEIQGEVIGFIDFCNDGARSAFLSNTK